MTNPAQTQTGTDRATENIITIKNLVTRFDVTGGLFRRVVGQVHAVEDVSINIKRGETFGLVGESGCGKTTLGKSLLGIYPQSTGSVHYHDKEDGQNYSLLNPEGATLKMLRRRLQIIFQDPYSSLNPRLTVREIVEEGMVIHNLGDRSERNRKARTLIDQVGLPANALDRYPHEFSGGQRQRIGIARALSVEPDFIVCDEAVSALDVSIQAQILTLLAGLQKEYSLTYLFISHDLGVVRHVSDHVAVMYLGRIVEQGDTAQIYTNPSHPYTRALLSAAPGQNRDERIILKGDVPSPVNPPSGCAFHTRCYKKTEACTSWQYRLSEIDNRHQAACLLYEK